LIAVRNGLCGGGKSPFAAESATSAPEGAIEAKHLPQRWKRYATQKQGRVSAASCVVAGHRSAWEGRCPVTTLNLKHISAAANTLAKIVEFSNSVFLVTSIRDSTHGISRFIADKLAEIFRNRENAPLITAASWEPPPRSNSKSQTETQMFES
jgi:hypothetical protein